ncbi:hypothetical protein Tco_1221426 [Tanacetum coccineum]
MLHICPNLPGQKFEDPPFEEEILAFRRDLGYPGDINSLSDVSVDTLYQPWRTFGTIINKCLSGKATGLDQLRLSRAQIIWGMYHQKNVDYVYLLWEDLVYQIENKASKKNKDMYYPRFTKYGAILLDNLTNQAMKESDAYKTYHDFATRKVIPNPKYVRRSTREKTDQAPTASPGKRLKATTKVAKQGKRKQHAQGVDEGTGVSPGVPGVPTYGSVDEQIFWKSSDEDDDDEVSISKDDDDDAENEDDDGQDDDNEQTESDNDGDEFVHPKFSTHYQEERQDEEDKDEEGSNLRVQTPSHFEITDDEAYNEVTQGVNTNVQGFISNMLNLNLDTGIDSILNLNTELTSLVDVPVTSNVEVSPSFVTTLPPPPIPHIQPQQQTPVSTPTIVTNRLRSEVEAYNEDFINKIDEIMKKIIKEQVKVQVKEQVSKILPKIKKFVNDQLEVEVLIRSSNEAKTTHAVAANLSELELKKILIDKIENNKSIDRSIQQKTLYKALVDAYEIDKDILETYGDTGSKRRRAGKEPESTSAPKEKTSKSTVKSKEGSKSHQKSIVKSSQAVEPIHADEDLEEPVHQEFDTGFTKDEPVDETTQHPDWFQKPTKPLTPYRDWNKTLPAKHGPVQPWISTSAQNEDPRESFNELMDTPLDFSAFVLNQLKVDTLTPELLAGPTFELMKDEDKLYTFKKGDYNRLRLQDIEDMLLLLVQGKLTNLNVEERLALGVSLRMFIRSVVLRRRVEDLQLGVESYQNKLNLTRPDTYRSDLKQKIPYTAYSNPKGFIYQNKDKKNRLIRIDELHKFSDGILNDVRSALDDILK